VVAITKEQEKLYQRTFPGLRTIGIPLGTKPRPPQDPEACRLRRTVVYVGHMHGSKGVAFLSKAAVELARRGIRTLFLGGYPANAARMAAHAAQNGVSDMVESHAFLPPTEMHALLAARASLGVVMLADTYSNRHLTCPVKALDYLSHGLPSLGTDIPTVRGVLGEACAYLPFEDMGAFITTAVELLDSAAAYAAAAARARARAEEFIWQNRARTLAAWVNS
jgi:glycosyltransferase involved in cell wall biosynthesis